MYKNQITRCLDGQSASAGPAKFDQIQQCFQPAHSGNKRALPTVYPCCYAKSVPVRHTEGTEDMDEVVDMSL